MSDFATKILTAAQESCLPTNPPSRVDAAAYANACFNSAFGAMQRHYGETAAAELAILGILMIWTDIVTQKYEARRAGE
jgi:hypothetical protein